MTYRQIILVTGKVGSGKSTICKMAFEHFNCLTIEVDDLSHQVMMEETIRKEVMEKLNLPKDFSFDEDRRSLARIAFGNSSKLKILTEIIGPHVGKLIHEMLDNFSDTAFVECFLMEGTFSIPHDKVWYCHAPTEERIRRVMSRDKRTREEVEMIVRNQMDLPITEELLDKFDLIIDTRHSWNLKNTIIEEGFDLL